MADSSEDEEPPPPAPPPPPPFAIPTIAKLSDDEIRAVALQRALESFYSTNLVSFDQHVNEFALSHAHELLVRDGDAGTQHTLRQHELFLEFVNLVDGALEAFLAEQQSSTEELMHFASAAAAQGKGWPCAEYLGAAADYESFIELMENAAKLQGYTLSQLG